MEDFTAVWREAAWVGGCIAAALAVSRFVEDKGEQALFLSTVFYVASGGLRVVRGVWRKKPHHSRPLEAGELRGRHAKMIESGFKTGSRAGPDHEQPRFTRGPNGRLRTGGPMAKARVAGWLCNFPNDAPSRTDNAQFPTDNAQFPTDNAQFPTDNVSSKTDRVSSKRRASSKRTASVQTESVSSKRTASAPNAERQLQTDGVSSKRTASAPNGRRQLQTNSVSSKRTASVPDGPRQLLTESVSSKRTTRPDPGCAFPRAPRIAPDQK